jgi:hypothetical protein
MLKSMAVLAFLDSLHQSEELVDILLLTLISCTSITVLFVGLAFLNNAIVYARKVRQNSASNPKE